MYPRGASASGPAAGLSVRDLDGLTPAQVTKLESWSVATSEQLRKANAAEVAVVTGIPVTRVRRLQARAGLVRVPGVTRDEARLLEAAGFKTLEALARQHPARLHARLAQAGEASSAGPAQDLAPETVAAWVRQAKALVPQTRAAPRRTPQRPKGLRATSWPGTQRVNTFRNVSTSFRES